MKNKGWIYLLFIIVFFGVIEIIQSKFPGATLAAATNLLPYVFYGLMGISAFIALFAVGVLILLWWADEEAQSDGAINQFMFAGILFCAAAIAAKLWGGFPV